MAKRYGTAAAFKASLETHLRKHAVAVRVPLSTVQLKFVIERLLARLFFDPTRPWLLKGGFAMDLRFRPHARTTKDVDLSVLHVSVETGAALTAALRERLQDAAAVDLGDHLTYRIGEPKHELTNAPKGGARYRCEAILVGKSYAKFQIDVGCGDVMAGEPEKLLGDDFLSFAGIAPATVFAIPKALQFSEKIHAYTFPWSGRQNTRTKDLVDLVLLIERGAPDVEQIRYALRATFSTRGTHQLPAALTRPPTAWATDFIGMATEAGLPTTDYMEAFERLQTFWIRHALGGAADA